MQVETFLLRDDGEIPNNDRLPLLVYKQAFSNESGGALADTIEETYYRNNWGGTWRWGVYDYHHYHSTAHEVLGCYRGRAEIQFGGEQGVTLSIEPGDAVVIPAGVGHKLIRSSMGFHVVGGYPEGQHHDMNTGRPGERPQADENISQVPLPAADPIAGKEGPLMEHWKA